MIFNVEKRRFRKNGTIRETRYYYLRYRIGDMPLDRWKSLRVTDKQTADKKAHEFIQEKEREAAGIIEPKLVRDSARKPLSEHLTDYVADLEARNRAGRRGRGGRLLKSRILRLIDGCGWKMAGNITADGFIVWRKQFRASARTLNHYLQGMVSFLNWMERTGRIKTNPLKFVGKVDERGQRKRVRRAFTDDELSKLVNGSASRGIIYFTAARTGLRQEELRQLLWGDLHLEEAVPCVVVRDSVAKNKKAEMVCLVPEIAEALQAHRPTNARQSDLVFAKGVPRACTLRVDAEKNGIAYRDESGRYADFHALRYTFATFMQRHGVSPRFAMKQMRHSELQETVKGYTDETQLPIYDSIKNLPRLRKCTHRYAQISGAEGQNVSRTVASGEGMGHQETVVNTGVWRTLTHGDAERDLVETKGVEPSTS